MNKLLLKGDLSPTGVGLPGDLLLKMGGGLPNRTSKGVYPVGPGDVLTFRRTMGNKCTHGPECLSSIYISVIFLVQFICSILSELWGL